MSRPRLVLASASPARATLLRNAGVDPLIRVAGVDEDAVLAAHGPASVAASVQVLATAKAEAVAAQLWPAGAKPGVDPAARPGGEPAAGSVPAPRTGDAGTDPLVVLGCDSLLELGGEAFGKPHTPERARERWRRIRGRSGVLHTGHQLIAAGRRASGVSSTTVHFADITDAEIAAYVDTGKPLTVAGAFTIDGYGGAFIRRIEGDHHGVMGLSLPLLRDLLSTVGMTWVDLWRQGAAAPSL